MIEIFLFNFNYLFLKFNYQEKNILSNTTGQFHQVYNQDYQVPLSGGLFIILYFYYSYEYFNILLIFYLSIFFSFRTSH